MAQSQHQQQQQQQNSNSSLSKYKQRIALYEDPTDPLAPLTSAQKQLILDLTHGPAERPIPAHLKPIPETKTVELVKGGELPKGVNFDKFSFKTKHEVYYYS